MDFTQNDEVQRDSSFSLFLRKISNSYQRILDTSTPYKLQRWLFACVLLILFLYRIIAAQGYYVVIYTLGIYLLTQFTLFLSPQFGTLDMDIMEDDMEDEPTLPVNNDDEFKPFIRRLPEFKFWHNTVRATLLAFVCAFIPFFDIPVFWPILLMYFIVITYLSMKKQIDHMIKHHYVPFDIGKKKYNKFDK
jgi:hypothetical protein